MTEPLQICFHIKMNGKRCRGIALAGKNYCRFHNRYYERHCVTNPDYQLPVFEDSRSLMMAIHELVHSRIRGKIDNRDITSYMYAYQVAASMMGRPDAMAPDVAAPFEREARKKVLIGSSRNDSRSQCEVEEPVDDRSLSEILIDTHEEMYQEFLQQEAARKGLPAPEPMPPDRDRTLRDIARTPEIGEKMAALFSKHYRRFPGDPWPDPSDEDDQPLVDEGAEQLEPTGEV